MGAIYKTTDAGESWNFVNSNTAENLYKTAAISTNIFIAVGANGTVIKSEDSGDSWTLINSGVTENLRGIYVTRTGSGYIAGDNNTILRSTDLGLTWDIISRNRPNNLNDVSFFGDNFGIIAGDKNDILFTQDGGSTWDSPTSVLSFGTDFKYVNVIDDRTAFITTSTGEIIKTIDAGYSWALSYKDLNSRSLNKITAVSPGNIAVAGNNGTILMSSDNGVSWYKVYSGTLNNLYSLNFTDPNTGFTGGGNETLLKTTDGGNTWSSIGFSPLMHNFSGTKSGRDEPVKILGNFPNPFNPSTMIKFELSLDAAVSVKIYDLLGRETAVLVNSFRTAGSYEVMFNASSLSSGIYFYKITAVSGSNKFEKVMKMVLTK
jgi:photosystem II stability/assembly factor-like uncharacterized protein